MFAAINASTVRNQLDLEDADYQQSSPPSGGAFEARDDAAGAHPLGEASSDNCGAREPDFMPIAPQLFEETGVPDALIEALLFRHLLAVGENTCQRIASQLCIPPGPLVDMLADLKNRQFLVYKGSSGVGDFQYTLTEAGRERARNYLESGSYCGPVPVPLDTYVASVHAQTIRHETPDHNALRHAFSDLLISDAMMGKLGPAVNSGRGLFLFGSPGNGKTSIAERITACFGNEVWIPRVIFADGELIQLYDPQVHEAVEVAPSILKGPSPDPRWVKIKRPTIVAGGELTMEALELKFNPQSQITEAPLQLKSNGGTLVIDDFGRQRLNPDELLNRWIVPLEKRYDFLRLSNGKKIQVPFDQLIIFSTNLEPKELVDDAFLRRIPYKINVCDPTEQEFRELLRVMADKVGVAYDESTAAYLIKKHYEEANRPLRCCHPRDLLLQIINRASYLRIQPEMTPEALDEACSNYFAVL